MNNVHLSSCPACARHVRVSEAACPFCGAALSDAFRARPAPRSPAARLSRSALYALGMGTVTLAAACSSSSSPGGTEDAGPPVADAGAPVADAAKGGASEAGVATPAYGASPHDAGEAPYDAGGVVAAYGAPVLPDGGGG
jgi:hypothetical protein